MPCEVTSLASRNNTAVHVFMFQDLNFYTILIAYLGVELSSNYV